MNADDLVHKAGLTHGDASEIEAGVMTPEPIVVIYGESLS